jgi:hypothetical protein
LEGGSDQDILMFHAQSEPKIETSIQSDAEGMSQRRQGIFEGGIGITKTVDVSSTYIQPFKWSAIFWIASSDIYFISSIILFQSFRIYFLRTLFLYYVHIDLMSGWGLW